MPVVYHVNAVSIMYKSIEKQVYINNIRAMCRFGVTFECNNADEGYCNLT